MASTILRGYDFYRYLLPGSLMAQTVRGIFSALNGSAPSPGDDNFPDWVLRNAIVGLTLGGYIESLPLIGGVISHQARNYVATGFTTGNRTSVDPFGLGDIAAVFDFLKLCNDILSHENKHWNAAATLKLANAIRGLGIAAGSILPDNQAGATIKGGLNAINTLGNVARDFLIRRTNDQRRRPPRHPKS